MVEEPTQFGGLAVAAVWEFSPRSFLGLGLRDDRGPVSDLEVCILGLERSGLVADLVGQLIEARDFVNP